MTEPDLSPGAEPLSLQGRMACQCEPKGRIRGSWQFGFDGQTFLLFDSQTGSWTVVHPGGKLMKGKWEKDRDVTEAFRKTSMGDCRAWFKEFWVHWKEFWSQEVTEEGKARAALWRRALPATLCVSVCVCVCLRESQNGACETC